MRRGDRLARRRLRARAGRDRRPASTIVMVNVEADVLAGPLLARGAPARGHRLLHGLRRPAGAGLRAGGLGARPAASRSSRPARARSTCRTTTPHAGRRSGSHYGLRRRRRAAAGMNPQMFNSFLDGTKSAIEMAAIANATGLARPEDGLAFPPVRHRRPAGPADPARRTAALLERSGHGRGRLLRRARRAAELPDNLRWGVYVVFRGAEPTTSALLPRSTALRPTLPAATPRCGGPTT